MVFLLLFSFLLLLSVIYFTSTSFTHSLNSCQSLSTPSSQDLNVQHCSFSIMLYPSQCYHILYRVATFLDVSFLHRSLSLHNAFTRTCSCRNMLYVYPQALDFRSGKGRNIGVKVQFLSGEEKEDVCPAIYGKSCSPSFLREAWCPIAYHNKLCNNLS